MMRRWWLLGVVVLFGANLNGCRTNTDVGNDPPVSMAEPIVRPATSEATTSDEDVFQVNFETSKGKFVVEVHPAWTPKGAARFRELVESGFFDGCRFFRVVPNFMVQFGINGDPKIQAKWREAPIKDDPVTQSNRRGYVTFAMAGPNTRTSQMFINFGNNASLDSQGFSPFGRVVNGMDVVDSIESKYRESPQQPKIQSQGNAYLTAEFPDLDYIIKATLAGDTGDAGAASESDKGSGTRNR